MDKPFNLFEASEPEVDSLVDLLLNLQSNLWPSLLPEWFSVEVPEVEQALTDEESREPDIQQSSQVQKPTWLF